MHFLCIRSFFQKPCHLMSHNVKFIFFTMVLVHVSFLNIVIPSTKNRIKKSYKRRCFPVNFAKFSKAHFLQNIAGQLFHIACIKLMSKDAFHCFHCFVFKNEI